MTQKRFTYDARFPNDIFDGKKIIHGETIVDLLNNLYEENQQLKKELASLQKQ